jgi:hypothetical protein
MGLTVLKPNPKVLRFLETLDVQLPPWKRGILEASAKAFNEYARPPVTTTYEERLMEEAKTIAEEREEFLFEDIEKEVKKWMAIVEGTTLPCVYLDDLRYYLWLKTLLNEIDKKEQIIEKLKRENSLFSEMMRGKKGEVSKNSSPSLE